MEEKQEGLGLGSARRFCQPIQSNPIYPFPSSHVRGGGWKPPWCGCSGRCLGVPEPTGPRPPLPPAVLPALGVAAPPRPARGVGAPPRDLGALPDGRLSGRGVLPKPGSRGTSFWFG